MPSILNDIAISVPILTAAYYPTFVRCKGMKLRSASSFNFIEVFFKTFAMACAHSATPQVS